MNKQFFSNPTPQQVDEEKLVELVAIRTRNLANEILEYADLNVEEAINEDERQIIEVLTGMRNLVYTHNDQNMRKGSVFADFTAQVIMFCLKSCLGNCSSTGKLSKQKSGKSWIGVSFQTKRPAVSLSRDQCILITATSGATNLNGLPPRRSNSKRHSKSTCDDKSHDYFLKISIIRKQPLRERLRDGCSIIEKVHFNDTPQI